MTARTLPIGRTSTSAVSTAETIDWRFRGACRDQEPDLFWPIGESAAARQQVEEAKEVCEWCPVRRECLDWALEARQDFGVWGGMSERERRVLHRRKAKAYGAHQVSAVDQIVTERLDLFQAAVGQGLDEAGIARELSTNVQTVKNVLARLVEEEQQLDAASEAVAA